MSRPERILVTGGAGFIGSTFVERCLGDGRRVVVLDAFDPFYAPEEKRRNLERAGARRGFRLVEGDIRDPAAVDAVFGSERFDAVVHLAALAGVRPSLAEPGRYADVNVNGTVIVLDAAVRHQVGRVVFASSSSVYGERPSGPFRESDPVERPISPYAATKRAGELLAHPFHYLHGLSITCARIFTAYGPRQRPDLAIRRFTEQMSRGEPIRVFGDGNQVRDFTYVDDLVEGLSRALDTDLGYAILNFGAGRTVSLREVIAGLEKELGVAARIEWCPPQPGDVPRTWADVSEARRALGYAPSVSLEEGLARFVEWWRGVTA